MKRLLILGAGTAGTMAANRLVHALDMSEWHITIVDQDEIHYYQPGFLFIPFGTYGKADVMRPKRDYLPREVEVVISPIELIDPAQKKVTLAKNKQVLSYDYLIIATGPDLAFDEIEGLGAHPTDEYTKRDIAVTVHGQTRLCLVYEINPRYVASARAIGHGDWLLAVHGG